AHRAGVGRSQQPYLVVPDVTLQGAAASPGAQRLLLVALGVGTAVVVPSLVLLFRVFRPVPVPPAGSEA
ncbi:cytochrome d ubiquinol oxidase subunit II, partial [Myxococcus sp. 1LA]